MSGHDELSDAKRPRGRYASYTRARLKQHSDRMARAIYPETAAAARIEIAGPTDRISFADAQRIAYREAAIREPLAPHWATWWVRVTAHVPESWRGARVDLYWDSCSEGLLWLDGRSAQGLNPDRHTAILRDRADGGEALSFFVEVACNGMFGAGGSGKRQGPASYRLAACEIRRFDPEAWDLFHDFETLRQLEADREPPQTSRAWGAVATRVVRPGLETAWAGRLLSDLNRVCNLNDNAAARKILAGLLSACNGSVALELSAVAHAHLDTAWLWPIEETRRKAQRTFSTAVGLMDRYSDFKFAVSQAYQYAVIEETDPDLFARIRAKVAAGQWIPIGGAWVEPDCNLPWGESLCRQFLYGQPISSARSGAARASSGTRMYSDMTASCRS